MSELRREARLRTFLKGRVVFNNGNAVVDCLVRDVSGTGARLTLSEGVTLPAAFDLHIPAKDQTHHCTLRWRREDGVGVHFVSARTSALPAPSGEEATAALHQRIRALEAENATLRRLLDEAEAAILGPRA